MNYPIFYKTLQSEIVDEQEQFYYQVLTTKIPQQIAIKIFSTGTNDYIRIKLQDSIRHSSDYQ